MTSSKEGEGGKAKCRVRAKDLGHKGLREGVGGSKNVQNCVMSFMNGPYK